MRFFAALLALSGLVAVGMAPALAQVVVEKEVITGATPLDLSIDRLLGPDVLSWPGTVVITQPALLPLPSLLEQSPPSHTYKPGIYMPGRYSTVMDLGSLVLPTIDWQ